MKSDTALNLHLVLAITTFIAIILVCKFIINDILAMILIFIIYAACIIIFAFINNSN